MAKDGSNTWNDKGKNQYYLLDNNSALLMTDRINHLMMHQPVTKR